MAEQTVTDDAALQDLQKRIRTLIQRKPQLKADTATAFPEFRRLVKLYLKATDNRWAKEKALARAQLARGHLVDPKFKEGAPMFLAHVSGMCPSSAASRIALLSHTNPENPELEAESAAIALTAFDRQTVYNDPRMAETQKGRMAAEFRKAIATGKFVERTWTVIVAQPDGWVDAPNPFSLARQDLERFSENDLRTIALYRLGGLADCGAIKPLIRKPLKTGDWLEDIMAYQDWQLRIPVQGNYDRLDTPVPSADMLPVEIAEQLFAIIEEEFDNPTPPKERAAMAMESAAGLLDQFSLSASVSYPVVEGDRRYGVTASNGIPIDDSGTTGLVTDAIAQFDQAIRLLGVVGSDSAPLPPHQIGMWKNWSYWKAPTDVKRVADLLLPLAIDVHSWYETKQMSQDLGQGMWRRYFPSDTPEWAVRVATQARAIADALRSKAPQAVASSSRSEESSQSTGGFQGIRRRTGMPRAEANEIAKERMQKVAGFGAMTAREWSYHIGCSVGGVAKLPLWKANQERIRRARPPRKPTVVSLTPKLLNNLAPSGKIGHSIATSSSEADTLRELIGEQESDLKDDPSPLESDLIGEPKRFPHIGGRH